MLRAHLGLQVEYVQADPATVVDVGVVHWRDEAHLGRLKGVPALSKRAHADPGNDTCTHKVIRGASGKWVYQHPMNLHFGYVYR
jgi:hypothetical protein